MNSEKIGTFEVTLRLPADVVDRFTDDLADELDSVPDVIGPMTSADRETGEVTLSFGVTPSGHPASDVARAFELLGRAFDLVAQREGRDRLGLPVPLIDSVERQSLALT